jgi:hypothetical protein
MEVQILSCAPFNLLFLQFFFILCLYNWYMPIVGCKRCNKRFYVRPSHIKRGWGKFCSSECLYSSMKTGKSVYCTICHKKIYRNLTQFGRSKSNHFYCSKNCFAIWKNAHVLIGEKHGNWKGGKNSYREIVKRAKIMPKCSTCGISNKRVLVVHHIDRDRNNNLLSNLKWLCRNCHYLEHNGKTL